MRYQGAHVRENNEGNVGVMVLGNFDLQHPSREQLTTLQATLIYLMHQYRVPGSRLYTHKELNPTTCPGRSLQQTVAWLRGSGRLT